MTIARLNQSIASSVIRDQGERRCALFFLTNWYESLCYRKKFLSINELDTFSICSFLHISSYKSHQLWSIHWLIFGLFSVLSVVSGVSMVHWSRLGIQCYQTRPGGLNYNYSVHLFCFHYRLLFYQLFSWSVVLECSALHRKIPSLYLKKTQQMFK